MRRPALLFAWSLALASVAGAQPHPEPGYQLLETPSVTVEHVADEGLARRVLRLYAESEREVEGRLGLALPEQPHVVLAPSDREFARRYALLAGRDPGGHVLAVAFPDRDLVIVRRSGLQEGTDAGLERTFQHELAHLALAGVERRRGRRLPRWLNEGLSEWAARRRLTSQERTTVEGWATSGSLPRLSTLTETFPSHGQASGRAYLVSAAFMNWVDDEGGCRELVLALQSSPDVDAAFREVLGRDVVAAELDWAIELKEGYSILESVVFNLNVWIVTALLALVAFARHAWVTRRKKAELAAADLAEDQARARARAAAAEAVDPPDPAST